MGWFGTDFKIPHTADLVDFFASKKAASNASRENTAGLNSAWAYDGLEAEANESIAIKNTQTALLALLLIAALVVIWAYLRP